MALSEACVNRLENWKFHSAWHHVSEGDEPGVTDDERTLIDALDATFGNVGWFDGSLSDIVRAAVSTLDPALRHDEEGK